MIGGYGDAWQGALLWVRDRASRCRYRHGLPRRASVNCSGACGSAIAPSNLRSWSCGHARGRATRNRCIGILRQGEREGLLLSLPEGALLLQPGDILVAFSVDGSRRYWGPFVVGTTSKPTRAGEGGEWQLIL